MKYKKEIMLAFSVLFFVFFFLFSYSLSYSYFYKFIISLIPSFFPKWTGILVCCIVALIGIGWSFSKLGDFCKSFFKIKEESYLYEFYEYLIRITIFCGFIALIGIFTAIAHPLVVFIENSSFAKNFDVFIKSLPDIYEISEKYLKITK
jgi:hypothetical protein